MAFIYALILTFSSLVMAQYSEQPLKESAIDLRSQTILFSLEIPDQKKTYLLERTANQDFFLRLKHKDKETIKKISGRDATRLDRDFASRFLRCQYEIPSIDGDCDVTLRLKMKGEEQEICEKDDKKSQAMTSLITELAKRF
jgi:hypothetical protein